MNAMAYMQRRISAQQIGTNQREAKGIREHGMVKWAKQESARIAREHREVEARIAKLDYRKAS